MTLTVFFGRWGLEGLASDAAMYAGLSRAILEHGHAWSPRGLSIFPVFFEHPPYFFQWGAMVLGGLGTSDGAARAIGAIPGAIAVIALVTWVWRRHSWPVAFWTLVFLLSFGHFTKYAATSMLEAPLSLGAVLFAVGTLEFFFVSEFRRRWLALACLGAAIATASKGVVGILFCAALSPYVLFFAPKDSRWFARKSAWFLCAGLAAAFPLVLWALMTWDNGTSLLGRYLNEQVFRSYSTDRGHPELYAQSWSWWSYPLVIVKYGWPWWWTVPVGAVWIFRRHNFSEVFLKSWTKLALAFFGVLFLVFSTSHVRLPHYLHPTYILLAPIGGYAMWTISSRFFTLSPLTSQRLRWISFGLLLFVMIFWFRGSSRSGDRGQEFAVLGRQLGALSMKCAVHVVDRELDAYRMESYSMWYLRGRAYRLLSESDFARSRAAFDSPKIWWSPSNGELLIHPDCSR